MGAVEEFDLIVIGSGPAGEKGAAQAAYFGKRVALVEGERSLGGAAANTGTLPSKTLRETALYLSGFRQRDLYGVDVVVRRAATVQEFLHRERVVRAGEQTRVARNLEQHAVSLYRGQASFVGVHDILVRGRAGDDAQLRAPFILVATGSSALRPPSLALDDPGVYDSDSILELTGIPETLIVVGAGVIGCEYACTFAALGVQVTLIDPRVQLLPFLDGELSRLLQQAMGRLGITLLLGDSVLAVTRSAGELSLGLRENGTVTTETVLVASGRTGNTAGLGLDVVGIEVTDRGHIRVNEHYQTSVPHIYAAGDVVGFPALASTSMEQGRIAVVHAFDLRYKTSLPTVLPYGIYTIPEVSMAGETEESLREGGIPYVVGRARYSENARGNIVGDELGLLKLLFRRGDMRLLGVHTLGEAASETVHVGVTALLMEATADFFIQTCFNYPTLSEAYKYATYDAMGRHRGDG